ncbi:hypothetical protein MNBD_PLANCTO02-1298 [hydrothermal vent metagenome]|uniref:Tetratricopeptide repeat protein n=1 Tax=hydrothermal vent metagenome TaxID=652676 RepID=A0A3B1E483_9ZZZZ
MAADKNKIAAMSYKRGSEALGKENWDFAIEMFSQAVTLCPDNLLYRQVLRGAEYRKYGNNKKGARMAGVKLAGTRNRIRKARKAKDWLLVSQEVEKGLQINPWDAGLNASLGEACRHLEYDNIAVYAYERTIEANKEDKANLTELAHVLEEMGEYKRAIICWTQIQKIDPENKEARSKIMGLEATKVSDRGGYEHAENTQDVRTSAYSDFVGKPGGPGAADGPGMSEEADLLRAIKKEPEKHAHYLKVADLYRKENRLEDAAEMLQKGLDASGGDPAIREQLEDVELQQMRQNMSLAHEASKKSDDPERAKKQIKLLNRELVQREIEILSARTERYPQDAKLKYQLAMRHMRFKNWTAAIPLLQQASSDSRMEGEVLCALGDCFLKDGKKSLAKRQFSKAVEQLNVQDHKELFKKAHYILGCLLQKEGNMEDAEEHFQEILSLDYEYKDTLQKLEEIQSQTAEEE